MSKPGYYAVKAGRAPGIYTTWGDCEAQTKGFPAAKYKKFGSLLDAESYLADVASVTGSIAVGPASLAMESSDSKGKKRAFAQVEDESDWDVVYSDGACKGNGKIGSVAGVGVWWGHGDSRNIGERCPGEQTNNRAELIAILRVLETAPDTKKPLLIKTDSQYSIRCLEEWRHSWVQSKWKVSSGGEVKNRVVIEVVAKMLDIRRCNQDVKLSYVKGHSGHVGNDGADYMANIGTTKPPLADRDWKALLATLEMQYKSMNLSASSGSRNPIVTESVDIHNANKVQKREIGDVKTTPELSQSASKKKQKKSPSPPPTSKPSKAQIPTSLSSPHPIKSHQSPKPTQASTSRTPKKKEKKPTSMSKPSTPPSPAPAMLSRKTEKSKASPKSTSVRPGVAIFALPPLVPVRPEDINFEDYADCLLDPEDLEKELEDS